MGIFWNDHILHGAGGEGVGGGVAPLREEEEDLIYNIWKVCSSLSNFF